MSAYRTFNMQRDKDKHRSTTCLLPTIRFGTGDHTCPITPYYPQQKLRSSCGADILAQ